MEFLTGVLQKETMEISDLVRPGLEGSEVKVNGAIHTIRDMGPIAFVILRKREGLLQCVYEPGAADFSLKDLKEADTIEVSGTLALSEKAPVRNRGQDEVGQDSFGAGRGNAIRFPNGK